jgi:hypothetical protein
VKFTIETRKLVKLLRAVAPESGTKVPGRNPLLRLIAEHNTVSIRINDVEAGCEAEVEEEGAAFFIFRKFLPLVRSYGKERRLTITVAAEGIKIGNTWASATLWELSLFADPQTAPDQPSNAIKPRRSKQVHPNRCGYYESDAPEIETEESYPPQRPRVWD